MQLQKTDKARAELQSGSRTLGQRERALLILADGKTTVGAVNHLFNGQAQILAHQCGSRDGKAVSRHKGYALRRHRY